MALPRTAWILFAILVCDLIAFTIVLPLLPALIEYYEQRPDAAQRAFQQLLDGLRNTLGIENTARWNSILIGGIIGFLFSILQFISAPIMGGLSDLLGRKPIMLLSSAGLCISYVLWGLSGSLVPFLISRIVAGLSKGNISVAISIATDITSTQNRGRAMAMVGVAFSIGFLVGPSLGGFYARNYRTAPTEAFFLVPAALSFLLSALSLLLSATLLPETLPCRNPNALANCVDLLLPSSLFGFRAVKVDDRHRLRIYGYIYFLYLLIFSGIEYTLSFVVHERFNYSSADQGKMFLFIGVIMILVQGGYVRRLPAGKEYEAARNSMLLLIPAFIVMALAQTQWLFYCALAVFSFVSATVVSFLTTSVSRLAPDNQRGTLLGVFRSLGALSRAIGPLTFCSLYWLFGSQTCYLIAAMSVLFPIMLFSF